MIDLLFEMKRMQENICIYTNANETTKFNFGSVLAANYEEFALYMISPDGNYDGILLEKTSRLYRIDQGGQYYKKMQALMNSSKLPNLDFDLCEESIKESLLNIAFKTKKIVSIELVDSENFDIIGIIEEIKNNLCRIRLIDEYGTEDGMSYVLVEDITSISFDSQDEILRLKLWHNLG